MPIIYGVTQTKYGHEVCFLQEDGRPSMTIGEPFSDPREALQECLRVTAKTEDRARQEAEWVLMFRLPIPNS